jgi:hypothetical protein
MVTIVVGKVVGNADGNVVGNVDGKIVGNVGGKMVDIVDRIESDLFSSIFLKFLFKLQVII